MTTWTKAKSPSVKTDSMWNGKDGDMREGSELIGLYVDKQDRNGDISAIYVIEDSGKRIGVWGSTVLESQFENVPKGSLVKIVYKGKSRGKTGRNYHDYEVYKGDD